MSSQYTNLEYTNSKFRTIKSSTLTNFTFAQLALGDKGQNPFWFSNQNVNLKLICQFFAKIINFFIKDKYNLLFSVSTLSAHFDIDLRF